MNGFPKLNLIAFSQKHQLEFRYKSLHLNICKGILFSECDIYFAYRSRICLHIYYAAPLISQNCQVFPIDSTHMHNLVFFIVRKKNSTRTYWQTRLC